MASDSPDAVTYQMDGTHDWAFMCAHCDRVETHAGRDEAFMMRTAIRHLDLIHGMRRTWIDVLDDRVTNAKQLALPIILDHLAGRNQRGY